MTRPIEELALDMAAITGLLEAATREEREALTEPIFKVIIEISRNLAYYSKEEREAVTAKKMIQDLSYKYKVWW